MSFGGTICGLEIDTEAREAGSILAQVVDSTLVRVVVLIEVLVADSIPAPEVGSILAQVVDFIEVLAVGFILVQAVGFILVQAVGFILVQAVGFIEVLVVGFIWGRTRSRICPIGRRVNIYCSIFRIMECNNMQSIYFNMASNVKLRKQCSKLLVNK
ncbi:hypothetical protein [Faecalibacterium sp. OM04-11BH]|uniref:hypothetical protein n=1 Tax=Faecalibacterium sp. OM04-11BH TaxID=2292357 RepID=UPI0013144596|nr:hypothetical protein [Faecalibacterium sp. OM04-11BH]